MDRSDCLKIAYKDIIIDYKEYSGEDFNMSWSEQCAMNADIFNNMKEKDRFYEENDKYVYDALAYYGKIPVKIHPLIKVLNKEDDILDFGCGTCCDLIALRLLGYNVDGVDVPSNHRRFGEWRLRKYNICAEIYDGIPNKHYDTVYSYDTIEHIRDWETYIDILCNISDRLIICWKFDSENGVIPFHYEHRDQDVIDYIESHGFIRDGTIIPRLPRIWIRDKMKGDQ